MSKVQKGSVGCVQGMSVRYAEGVGDITEMVGWD